MMPIETTVRCCWSPIKLTAKGPVRILADGDQMLGACFYKVIYYYVKVIRRCVQSLAPELCPRMHPSRGLWGCVRIGDWGLHCSVLHGNGNSETTLIVNNQRVVKLRHVPFPKTQIKNDYGNTDNYQSWWQGPGTRQTSHTFVFAHLHNSSVIKGVCKLEVASLGSI